MTITPAIPIAPPEPGALQEVTGIDPYSYPRGVLVEALLVLGGQHREELRAHFQGQEA
jgi:hypothetical protein